MQLKNKLPDVGSQPARVISYHSLLKDVIRANILKRRERNLGAYVRKGLPRYQMFEGPRESYAVRVGRAMDDT